MKTEHFITALRPDEIAKEIAGLDRAALLALRDKLVDRIRLLVVQNRIAEMRAREADMRFGQAFIKCARDALPPETFRQIAAAAGAVARTERGA